MPPTNNPESEMERQMTPEKAREYICQENYAIKIGAFPKGYLSSGRYLQARGFLQGVSYQEEKARGLVGRLRAQIIYQMSPGHSRACTAAFGAGDCSCGYEQMKTLVSESAWVLNDSGGPKGPLEGNP